MIRFRFDEPISTVVKDSDDAASDPRAGLFDYSAPLVAKFLELALDGLQRGIGCIGQARGDFLRRQYFAGQRKDNAYLVDSLLMVGVFIL